MGRPRLFVSRLGVVETISVLVKKVRNGIIAPSDFTLLRRRFFADFRKGRPVIVRMLVRHFQEADKLLENHGPGRSLFTLDALQLAVALDLQRRGMLDEVVSADHVFGTVATLEGLKVMNPETP